MIAGLERQTINLDPYHKNKYNLFYDAILLRITITIYCKLNCSGGVLKLLKSTTFYNNSYDLY